MIKIGITGHQNLGGSKNEQIIIDLIKKELSDKGKTIGYSSLAIGADQLFAEIFISLKKPFVSVLPCYNYVDTFKMEDLLNYQKLIKSTKEIIRLPFSKPSGKAFYEAGKYIVEEVDVLIAVWDGKPAENLGGTGDAVNYALSKKKKIIQVHPTSKQVTYL